MPTDKFNVVVTVIRTGKIVKMNTTPMNHNEACTFLSKLAKYPWRQEMLRPI